MSLAALSSPGIAQWTVSRAVYLYIAALEVYVLNCRMAGMPARVVGGRQWSSTRRRSCSVSSLSSLAWSTRLTRAVSSWRSRTHLASVNDEVTT